MIHIHVGCPRKLQQQLSKVYSTAIIVKGQTAQHLKIKVNHTSSLQNESSTIHYYIIQLYALCAEKCAFWLYINLYKFKNNLK